MAWGGDENKSRRQPQLKPSFFCSACKKKISIGSWWLPSQLFPHKSTQGVYASLARRYVLWAIQAAVGKSFKWLANRSKITHDPGKSINSGLPSKEGKKGQMDSLPLMCKIWMLSLHTEWSQGLLLMGWIHDLWLGSHKVPSHKAQLSSHSGITLPQSQIAQGKSRRDSGYGLFSRHKVLSSLLFFNVLWILQLCRRLGWVTVLEKQLTFQPAPASPV